MLEEAQSIDKFWEYIKHILSVCLYHMWEAEIFFFFREKKKGSNTLCLHSALQIQSLYTYNISYGYQNNSRSKLSQLCD